MSHFFIQDTANNFIKFVNKRYHVMSEIANNFQVEVAPAREAWLDIQEIDPESTYSRRELAKAWGLSTKTIYRWHKFSLNYAPLYSDAFARTVYQATCDDCSECYEVRFLEYQKARRKTPMICPHCESLNVPQLKMLEATDAIIKIPGKSAKILRLVGELIAGLGYSKAKEALTTDPDYKELRNFIRQFGKGLN